MAKTVTLLVVGMQHRVTQSTRKMIRLKSENEGPIPVKLVREPDNVHDENAIKVIIAGSVYKGMHIGYLTRGVAQEYAHKIDEGRIKLTDALMPIIHDESGDAEIVVKVIRPKVKTPAKKRVYKKSAKKA